MKDSSHIVYLQDNCLEVHVYRNSSLSVVLAQACSSHCISKTAHQSFPLFQYHQLLIHETYNGEFTANASVFFTSTHATPHTCLISKIKRLSSALENFSQGKKSIAITHFLAKRTQGDSALGPVRVQIY